MNHISYELADERQRELRAAADRNRLRRELPPRWVRRRRRFGTEPRTRHSVD